MTTTDSNSPPIWIKRGLEFEDAGQHAQARVAYSHAFRTEKPTTRSCGLLVRALIDIGDFESAKTILDTVCPPEKESPHHHFVCLRAKYAKSLSDFQEEEYWLRRIKLPRETFPLIFLGSCLVRQGRIDEAIQCHLEATKFPYKEGVSQPDEAWLNIAYALRAREDYGGALEAVNQALKLDPNFESAKHTAADLEAAIECQKQPFDPDDNAPSVFDLYNADMYAHAFVVAQKRLELLPDWLFGKAKLGKLLIDFRQFSAAEDLIREIESPEFFEFYAKSFEEEDPAEGRSYAEKDIGPAVLELKAKLAMTRGDLPEAEHFLKRFLKLQPLRGDQIVELGECLTLQRRTREAFDVYQRLRERTSNGWTEEWAIRESGHLLRAEQRYQEAAEIYLDGAIRFPENDEFNNLAEDALAASKLHQQLFEAIPENRT